MWKSIKKVEKEEKVIGTPNDKQKLQIFTL